MVLRSARASRAKSSASITSENFKSCMLIPLDKSPGIRLIGIGEVLKRIIGKTVSAFLKEELKEAAGSLQVCGSHNAGAEAAIHAMSEVFIEQKKQMEFC